MDTQDDLDFLKQLEATDPDFVREYTGVVKPEMVNKASEKIFSVRECANILNVCQNTILNHIRSGKIKATLCDGRWNITESDFAAYRQSINIVRGKNDRSIIVSKNKTQSVKEDKVSSRHVYHKATSRSVTDFLHTWHRNRSSGFSLPTICRDFNQLSEVPTNESQMSGILSSLAKKGIVIRKGKGIYQVSPSIVGEAVPNESQEQLASPTFLVDEPVREASTRIYPKKIERLALESFIADNFDQQQDLVFTVDELSRKFPHLNRTKLGKACINMHTGGKLERGTGVGEYIKRAVQPKQPERSVAVPPAASAVASTPSRGMDGVKKIMDSNLDEGLKLELIKRFLD